jgi:hypothetical protein
MRAVLRTEGPDCHINDPAVANRVPAAAPLRPSRVSAPTARSAAYARKHTTCSAAKPRPMRAVLRTEGPDCHINAPAVPNPSPPQPLQPSRVSAPTARSAAFRGKAAANEHGLRPLHRGQDLLDPCRFASVET